MRTMEATNLKSIYGGLALYASTLAFVISNLIGKRPKSKTERAVDGLARYSKLRNIAKSHRLQAADFEIQAEKLRLEFRSERRFFRRAREEEFYRRLSMERSE